MYRIAASSAVALFLALPSLASAQSRTDWTGWQIGADLQTWGGRSEADIHLDPARNAFYAYVETPRARNFERKDDLDLSPAASARLAYLHAVGPVVVGLEASYRRQGIEQTTVVGPVAASPVYGGVPRFLIYLIGSDDTLTAHFKTEDVASLKLRLGLPVGHRTLASAYVGVSQMKATASLRQDTTYYGLNYLGGINNPAYGVGYAVTEGQASNDLVAIQVGGIIDMALDEHWALRAQAGAAFSDSLTVESGGVTYGRSVYQVEPKLYEAAIGLSYRF